MGGAGFAGVDIRPRSVPDLLDGALRLYLSRFAPLFLIALVGGLVAWLPVLAGHPLVLPAGVYLPAFVRNFAGMAGGRQAPWWGSLVAALAGLLTQCALFRAAHLTLTRPGPLPGAGDIIANAFRRVWPFFVVGLTIGLVAGFGSVLLLVPTVWFGTWWAVAPAVTVIEERRAAHSLGRSRALVGGAFWHTLWAVFLGLFAAGILAWVLSLGSAVFAALSGTSGELLAGIWSAAASSLLTPYVACLITLLYYDLRTRKEGLDLVAGAGPAGGAA